MNHASVRNIISSPGGEQDVWNCISFTHTLTGRKRDACLVNTMSLCRRHFVQYNSGSNYVNNLLVQTTNPSLHFSPEKRLGKKIFFFPARALGEKKTASRESCPIRDKGGHKPNSVTREEAGLGSGSGEPKRKVEEEEDFINQSMVTAELLADHPTDLDLRPKNRWCFQNTQLFMLAT